MKKALLVLTTIMLVFAVAGCSNGTATKSSSNTPTPPPGPTKGVLKVPKTLELEENQYADGYQGRVDVGATIKKDDEWTLDVKFTVSRAVPDGIMIGLVDTVTDYWNPLSYDGKAKKGEPNAMFQTEALVTGIEYTLKEVFIALKDSGGTTKAHNQLIFQTEKEYTRPEADEGKHTAGANNPVTITFISDVPPDETGNPLLEFVAKAYDPADADLQGTDNKYYQFSGVNSDFSKFTASKYLVIVSKGHTVNAGGFGTISVILNGPSSGGSGWAETKVGSSDNAGWTSISHTATDVVCFVIELDKLTKYTEWLGGSWGQLCIGMYPDVQPLSVQAVLVVKGGADAVFDKLTDKVVLAEEKTKTLGFASKSIDVTDLY